MSNKSKKSSKPAEIHYPDELRAMMSDSDIQNLKRSVRRKQGTCAVCQRKLGKTKPLALSFAPTQVTDMVTMAGTWHMTVTHRWCQKEAIRDDVGTMPQHTYMTTLMALPVEQSTDAPRQVPVMMINPTIDHRLLYHDKDGAWLSATEKTLEDTVGFGRMTKTPAKGPEETGLTAYVNNANITAALNDQGLSWTHEQPEANSEAVDALAENLKKLIAEWDNTILVMVSSKLKSWEPQQILADLPELLGNGDILAATANVEFKEPTAHVVNRVFAAATEPGANGH